MDESELIRLIKLSVPALLVVIVILFLLTVFKAKWAADMARNTELDNDKLRKEMELLAQNKIAQRDGENSAAANNTLNTASPETRIPASVSPEKVSVDNVDIENKENKENIENKENKENNVSDGFIEGEPLA